MSPPTLPYTNRSASKMRSKGRPSSRGGPPPTVPDRTSASMPMWKIFNCIVDDTALVAGVKRSTRNGIRQWVRNGQIRLFVPLNALEELSRQKNSPGRHGEDVRETLQWLDEATTKFPNVVGLQGADETYEKWSEVQQFAVPRTLFSEHNHDLEHDVDDDYNDLPDQTANRLLLSPGRSHKTINSSVASDHTQSMSPSSLRSDRTSASPISPPTSPAKAGNPSPMRTMASRASPPAQTPSSGSHVPETMQQLFSYILWRIHQETDPVAALESFIFLCNDPSKVQFAKGFEIKTKRLEQLRDAVSREDRDYKNRQNLLNRETHQIHKRGTSGASDQQNEVDESAILKTPPPKAPVAMLQHQQQPPAEANVMDPNAFTRSPVPPPPTGPSLETPTTPKWPKASTLHAPRSSPRSGYARSGRGGGNGGNGGGFRSASGAQQAQSRSDHTGKSGGRGGAVSGPAAAMASEPANVVVNTKPIDPDSFARPGSRGGGFAGSTTRGARKLWVP